MFSVLTGSFRVRTARRSFANVLQCPSVSDPVLRCSSAAKCCPPQCHAVSFGISQSRALRCSRLSSVCDVLVPAPSVPSAPLPVAVLYPGEEGGKGWRAWGSPRLANNGPLPEDDAHPPVIWRLLPVRTSLCCYVDERLAAWVVRFTFIFFSFLLLEMYGWVHMTPGLGDSGEWRENGLRKMQCARVSASAML